MVEQGLNRSQITDEHGEENPTKYALLVLVGKRSKVGSTVREIILELQPWPTPVATNAPGSLLSKNENFPKSENPCQK